MNIFEEALIKVVEHMMAQKNLEAQDESLKLLMARKMGDKITDMAKMTSDGANHAGRSKPGYFDVERTFLRMNIKPEDLRAEVKDNAGKPKPKIVFPDPERTCTREHHTAAKPLLGASTANEMAKHTNIPSFIGPFPGPHSYKETPMVAVLDKTSVVECREKMALKRLNERNALNRLKMRSKPTVSLFSEPCPRFDLLDVEPPKRPAYLDALMPRDQTYPIDIYDNKDSITPQALKNRFLMAPKPPGTKKTPFHVDLECGMTRDTDTEDIVRDDLLLSSIKVTKEEPSMDILENKTDFNIVKDAQILKTVGSPKTGMIIESADCPKMPETTEDISNMQQNIVPIVMETDSVSEVEKTKENLVQKHEESVEQASTSGSGMKVCEKSHRRQNRSEKKHKKREKSSKDLKIPQTIGTEDPSEDSKTTEDSSNFKWNLFPTGKATDDVLQVEENKENVPISVNVIIDEDQVSTSGSGNDHFTKKSQKKRAHSEKKLEKKDTYSKNSKTNLNLGKSPQIIDSKDSPKTAETRLKDSSNNKQNIFLTGKATTDDVSQVEKRVIPEQKLEQWVGQAASSSGTGKDIANKKAHKYLTRSEKKLNKDLKTEYDLSLAKAPKLMEQEILVSGESSNILPAAKYDDVQISVHKNTKEQKCVVERDEQAASSSGSCKAASKNRARSERKKRNNDMKTNRNLAKDLQIISPAKPAERTKTTKDSLKILQKQKVPEEMKKNEQAASTSVSGNDDSGTTGYQTRTRSEQKRFKDVPKAEKQNVYLGKGLKPKNKNIDKEKLEEKASTSGSSRKSKKRLSSTVKKSKNKDQKRTKRNP